jgi:hypothetical protein
MRFAYGGAEARSAGVLLNFGAPVLRQQNGVVPA